MAGEESSPRRRSWRLWPRFRLRTFLVAVAFIAVGFGLLGRELVRLHRQRVIVSELISSGATVAYDYQLVGNRIDLSRSPGINPLRSVFGSDLGTTAIYFQWVTPPASDELVARMAELPTVAYTLLSGPNVTDKAVDHLQRLQLLEEVNLIDVGMTANGMRALSECPKLRYFHLCGNFVSDAHLEALDFGSRLQELQILRAPNVTDAGVSTLDRFDHLEYLDFYSVPKLDDAGIAVVARIPSLKSLNFIETSITDEALHDIAKLPRLERLGLQYHPIHDDGIQLLSGLKRIKSLQLAYTKISNSALATVRTFRDLEELDLSGTSISDAGLSELSTLAKLTSLQLMETDVTNKGLSKLGQMKALRKLTVTLGPNLTREGVRHLKECLPECRIECYQRQVAGGALLETTE